MGEKTLDYYLLYVEGTRSGRRSRKFESCHLDHEKALETLDFQGFFVLLVTQFLEGCYAVCYANLCNTLAFKISLHCAIN